MFPHDPQHPLKQYPSSLEFTAELTRQLRDADALQLPKFFSQFVPHQQRGICLAAERPDRARSNGNQPRPLQLAELRRETPVDEPQPAISPVERQERSGHRFQQRSWATSTAKITRYSTTRRISRFPPSTCRRGRLGLVGQPGKNAWTFSMRVAGGRRWCPAMGELMLAYTAYQLTDELVEGPRRSGRRPRRRGWRAGVISGGKRCATGCVRRGSAIGNVARAQLSPFSKA